MLGDTFQADIPLQMWVYPARTGTPLPDVFTQSPRCPPSRSGSRPHRSTPAARDG